ncbi:hypothetical protein ASD67_17610 [Sphingopyxis sp. Root1497]|uniref:HNH endonuclease n=1 Tax=Sphingopyxis sp. Root1497 TaxID=1736474 RepID=UPI0006FE3846|nr:HNH endonuclease [Sphingopyxis sp. Root1497]KQZ61092.1 hypothetical protein ASD67_17610 [Sphingopyxis sp. Root1497]
MTAPDDIAAVRGVLEPGSPALAAFDYLLAHASAAAFEIADSSHGTIRSVAFRAPSDSRPHFSAIANPRHITFYLLSGLPSAHPALFAAASATFGSVTDNRKGEYRVRRHAPQEIDTLLDFLRTQAVWPSRPHDRRFVRRTFEPVSAAHIRRAAQQLVAGYAEHGFGPSTQYDLLFEGHRLPPKAVFGIAATEALGFPVRPVNFTAGDGESCFRILRENGFPIVSKGEALDSEPAIADDEERAWSEGAQRLVTHLRRERATGLAAEKRDAFRARHGRLYCERCEMDPVRTYGKAGEACIEVHHRETHVADMEAGHRTRLEDLMCLCANCHRVAHRELAGKQIGPG